MWKSAKLPSRRPTTPADVEDDEGRTNIAISKGRQKEATWWIASPTTTVFGCPRMLRASPTLILFYHLV